MQGLVKLFRHSEAELSQPEHPSSKTGSMWKFFNYLPLCGHFLGHMGLKPSVFPFYPILFHVKCEGAEEHFCPYIRSTPGDKSTETYSFIVCTSKCKVPVCKTKCNSALEFKFTNE